MNKSVDVVIIGAGGHGREILDIVIENKNDGDRLNPIGFIDDDISMRGEIVDGYEVICGSGQIGDHFDYSEVNLVCGIGDPKINRMVVQRLLHQGYKFVSVVSNRAFVARNVCLGNGSVIFPAVNINTGCKIGRFVTVNIGSTISHDSRIGDFSNINPGCHIAGNVNIEEGCYVGMGSSVIQNIQIGERCVVGAGSVVVQNFGENLLLYGVPAKKIKEFTLR